MWNARRSLIALCGVGLVGAAAGWARAQSPQAAEPPAPSAIVWCHDAERGLVSRRRAADCLGEAVSEQRAQEIRSNRMRLIQNKMQPSESLIPGRRPSGSGTGFFVSAHGHVITNHHVIAECPGLSVTPAGGQPTVATLMASDRGNDLALLSAPLRPPLFAGFRGPERPPVDEEVLVVGYPLHGMVAIKPILVSGRVAPPTALPAPAGRFPIRIDIRRGNSGSPVLDRAGRVIGVISSKINTPAVYATTGQVVRDIGLAIGLAPVFDLMRQNSVGVVGGPNSDAMDGDALQAHAERLVAQVGCWR